MKLMLWLKPYDAFPSLHKLYFSHNLLVFEIFIMKVSIIYSIYLLTYLIILLYVS